ncbi:heavy-metal-associated domain-containing protein [Desulfobacula sp.]|uniref:heavy-metal-associated domain-containing protein n=1 Tax=Desulfobacula sp. TaxID=2593537 RepID=UPI002619EBC5|nr:heavy-metal-associated domain-containing protein [Desulfobacula sp.]
MKKSLYIIWGSVVLGMVLPAGWAWAAPPQIKPINRAIIKIDNLSCGSCFSIIADRLASLEGYSGFGANLFRKLIAIDFTAPLTDEKISRKLSEIGYPGKLETIGIISQKESFAHLDSRRTGFASNGGRCCSREGPPGNSGENRGSSHRVTPPEDTCCTLPGISPSTL